MNVDEEYKSFPVITEELMEALEERFPDKMPVCTTFPEICRLQGQVAVVRLLKSVRKEQTDNIITATLEER
tara:strand:- start:108 stop:320 length:213 start_codon:yes stop_codon:yes gene_type:complete